MAEKAGFRMLIFLIASFLFVLPVFMRAEKTALRSGSDILILSLEPTKASEVDTDLHSRLILESVFKGGDWLGRSYAPKAQQTLGDDLFSDDGGVKFGLKLMGGLAQIANKDLKTEYEDVNRYYSNQTYTSIVGGSLKAPQQGYEAGGEIVIDLMPQIGIGLGAGYLLVEKESALELDVQGSGRQTNSTKPKISAIPFTASLYLGLPVGDFLNLKAFGGVGYYMGKYEWNSTWTYSSYAKKSTFESESNVIGFHGGVSLEFNLADSFAFVVDGMYRVAKLKDLKGDYNFTGDPTLKDAYAWYVEGRSSSGEKWIETMFMKEEPTFGDVESVRKAEVDLSGFAAKAGFKIIF